MIFVHVVGLLLITVVATTGYFLIRYPARGLPNIVTVKSLGDIEGNLKQLKRVIVVADHVEAPDDALRHAVEKNFARGVQYYFLVSKSKANAELGGYYKIFEALAVIVSNRSAQKIKAEDLVKIQRLSYDWEDVPHILYETADIREAKYFLARGNQSREGIADFYSFERSDQTRIFARAILSDAPSGIALENVRFEDGSGGKIFQFVRPGPTPAVQG